MTIQATELLQLFVKANKLGLRVAVTEDEDGDYVVRIVQMLSSERFDETVVITQECETDWSKGYQSFHSMMDLLVEKLEEEEQKRIKAEKRKELIARLTPEERELLDLK
jgi:ribosomal protein L31E